MSSYRRRYQATNTRGSLLALFVFLAFPVSAAAMSVTLTPLADFPAVVGGPVTWAADVADASAGTLWYRFRARESEGTFHIVRDFGPPTYIEWTAAEHEGWYEMEVSVRNRDTGETAITSVAYPFVSRLFGNAPVINPTQNPLVYLYSAPPCVENSRMRTQFRDTDGAVRSTPFKACTGLSMNFYIAGLRANTSYIVWYAIETGSEQIAGPELPFMTGDSGAPPDLFTQTVVDPPAGGATGILLASSFLVPAATDLAGNLLWYVTNGLSFITATDPGGYFWGIHEDSLVDSSFQFIRKFDLTGMTILETNAARVNEQLAARGARQISAFHHDVRTLPDGRIAAIAAVEQILPDVQGPEPIDILGDMIIVFDADLNVVWTWDTFDHLDVTRLAVLGEVCKPSGGGCPPFYLSDTANDWTHSNSLQPTPDGNLLLSIRHQDWIVKIDYRNGDGDGGVIWKLGKDGDFQFPAGDDYPWFSHQHDANFTASNDSTLMLFDNGNTRIRANNGSGHSRGQALRLDEQNRTVAFVLNVDLGVFSLALGSAQSLPNGTFSFDAGYVVDPSIIDGAAAYAVEVDAAGMILYRTKADSILYRWIRMADLYTPQ